MRYFIRENQRYPRENPFPKPNVSRRKRGGRRRNRRGQAKSLDFPTKTTNAAADRGARIAIEPNPCGPDSRSLPDTKNGASPMLVGFRILMRFGPQQHRTNRKSGIGDRASWKEAILGVFSPSLNSGVSAAPRRGRWAIFLEPKCCR